MKKLLVTLLLIASSSYADQMSDARNQALNFGSTFKNTASSTITAQNKNATPGYTTDNPDQTKYFNGASTEEDTQAKIANSSEGQLMTKGLPNRPVVTISPSDDFLNKSKAITNNPDDVVAMLTGTYGECKPLTYSKTEYEVKTCDEYDEVDCVNGADLVKVSGAETTFNYPTIETYLSWRGGGGCRKYYSYTNVEIKDITKIQSLSLVYVSWDDVIRIKVNGNTVFENGNINSGRCERGTVFGSSPNVDLKPYLINGVNQIELALGVSGMGFADAKYIINYPKDKVCQHVDNCVAIPSSCQLQSSNCLNVSSQNICNYRQKIYQCSKTTTSSVVNVQCGSNIYCLNGQCNQIENNSGGSDFATSIAYLAAVNQAGKEKNNSIDDLKIFTGEGKSCERTSLLGYNSCCTDSGWGQDFGASCSTEEKTLIDLQSKKLCHFVGSYCSKKTLLGSCQTIKKSYCCFTSKISRVIVEQGRGQLAMGWGSAESPECRGFTAEELQKLKFDQMDLSEISSDIVNSVVVPDQSYLEGKVKQTISRYDQNSN